MEQKYSVQQIKFELLSYLKEFGSNGSEWTIQLASGADDQTIAHVVADEAEQNIWICKPTLSARAAEIIKDHMVSRFGVKFNPDVIAPSDETKEKNWILMYREAEKHAAA